jgi:hypothetical protein
MSRRAQSVEMHVIENWLSCELLLDANLTATFWSCRENPEVPLLALAPKFSGLTGAGLVIDPFREINDTEICGNDTSMANDAELNV